LLGIHFDREDGSSRLIRNVGIRGVTSRRLHSAYYVRVGVGVGHTKQPETERVDSSGNGPRLYSRAACFDLGIVASLSPSKQVPAEYLN
jgi:hypothetical protein